MAKLIGILLFFVLAFSLSFAVSDEEKAKAVAEKAAARLGWASPPQRNADDSIPGTSYLISVDGQGEDSEVRGYIAVINPVDWAYYSWVLSEVDMEHSSFHGRDAYISKPGELCNPKGIISKFIKEFVTGFFESIFGPSEEETCMTQHGTIVFVCGNYMMMGTDETDQGNEVDIASAFATSAQEMGLCDYGDTVVIMAQPTDLAGVEKISKAERLAQKVNEYYGVVSYGQYPPFKFSFMDADGSKGTNDWFEVPGTTASYKLANGVVDFDRYAAEAIKAAFKGKDLPNDLYLERVVIVYPGESHQVDKNAIFYDACVWHSDANYVEVDAAQGKRRVYVKNYIFLNQNRDLGTWAHEFGHSIPSKHQLPNGFARISDRYNYQGVRYGQYGEIYKWGLMGYGSWNGGNGVNPAHMVGFTKNAAGWLGYSQASLNSTYTLTALEDMKKGDSLLVLDDPNSNDANYYYIIEARDSTKIFGGIESGVVIYKVSMRDGYPVVNSLFPQAPSIKIEVDGQRVPRATLFSQSGEGSSYTSVPGKFKVILQSKGDSSSTIKIVPYDPRSMAGAIINAFGGGFVQIPGRLISAPPREEGPSPDSDLHAYDSNGNHVGMNYNTGVYENQIPGAIASGDLSNDEEWIFVPEGTDVRFEVSTYDTQKFLEQNPEYATYLTPHEVKITEVKFDSNGRRYEADGGKISLSAGQTQQIRSPTDPSLKYEQKEIPGVGNNKLCGILFVFPLALAGSFIFARVVR
ncbi:MAG: hypothetical protein QW035_00290 [Candidatus Anstonellales archaeon]